MNFEMIAKGIASIGVCATAITIVIYRPTDSCIAAVVLIVGLAVVWNVRLIGSDA